MIQNNQTHFDLPGGSGITTLTSVVLLQRMVVPSRLRAQCWKTFLQPTPPVHNPC